MANTAMDVDAHSYDESYLDEYLRIYYRNDLILFFAKFIERLFPFKEMHLWLNYGNTEKDYFLRREFSFTLKGDIYTRFKSFPTADAFSTTVKKDNPHKIDIGAVYSIPPRDKAKNESSFIAKEKELVFDIDLTDYDEIRTCCSGANICEKCWIWATIAIEVMDRVLREDFGFKHLTWIYSGRRGVHCWVCDSRARVLSAEARGAIADYISVITGGEGKARKVQIGTKLHPALKKAYDDVLVPFFEENILVNQKLLETEESQKKILSSIPVESIRNAILKDWKDSDSSPLQKWEDLKKTVEVHISKKEIKDINPVYDIVFTYTYPRLDVNVSLGVNHLLKSPFCVHPKTGRVCIPIDPKKAREFNPLKAPQVQQLIEEIDAYDKYHAGDAQNSKSIKDYKKTQLGKYIKQFKEDFLRPLQVSLRDEQRQQLQSNQGDQVSLCPSNVMMEEKLKQKKASLVLSESAYADHQIVNGNHESFINRFRKPKERIIPNQQHLLKKIYFALQMKINPTFQPKISQVPEEHLIRLVENYIIPEIENLPSPSIFKTLMDENATIPGLQQELSSAKKSNFKGLQQVYENHLKELMGELNSNQARLRLIEDSQNEKDRILSQLKTENEILKNKVVEQMLAVQDERNRREEAEHLLHEARIKNPDLDTKETEINKPPEEFLDAVHTLSRILSAKIGENGSSNMKDLLREDTDSPLDMETRAFPLPPSLIVENESKFKTTAAQISFSSPRPTNNTEHKNSHSEIITAIKNIRPDSEARLNAISTAIQERERSKGLSFTEKINSDFQLRKMQLNRTGGNAYFTLDYKLSGIEKVEEERKKRDEETRKALIHILKDTELQIEHEEKNNISLLLKTFFGAKQLKQ